MNRPKTKTAAAAATTTLATAAAAEEKRIWKVFVIIEHGMHGGPVRIRHAGLFFSYGDARDVWYFDAVYDGSRFNFQRLDNFDPFQHAVVAAHVAVGPMAYGIAGRDLIDVMRSVEIPTRAEDPEYNCQKWVQAALTKLYLRAFLTYGQYAQGFMGLQANRVLAKQ